MNLAGRPALELAIASFLAPGLFQRLRQRALPDDLLLLLRIAGGDRVARDSAIHASGQRPELVVEAARLYIQQVMFHPGNDSYRVLGVPRQASDERIKEHYRWLVHWLHPDHRGDDWSSVYADRVNLAWRDLRTPQRRLQYDARIARAEIAQPAWAAASGSPLEAQENAFAADNSYFSTRTVRRLPLVILGGLALTAFAVLALQYALTREPPGPEPLADVAISPAAMPDLLLAPLPADPPSETRPAAAGLLPESPVSAVAVEKAPAQPGAIVAPPSKPGRLGPVEAPPSSKQASRRPGERNVAVVTETPAPRKSRKKTAAPSVAAQPSPQAIAASTQPSNDDRAAQELLLRFRDAYASGDIEQVRALLTTRALGWRSDRRRIIRTYRKLFDTSTSRRIRIDSPVWLFEDDKATVLAGYQAWIVPHGQTTGHSVTGDMRLELRREKGQLRIVRLRHQPHIGVSIAKQGMSQE